jgi:retron-type reverse transcriptase
MISSLKKDDKLELELNMTKIMEPTLNIIRGIQKRSYEQRDQKDQKKFDDLYSLLCKESLLIQAYGNIQANKGKLTKGINNDTIDGTSLKKIKKITLSLKNQEFKFSKLRRIWIEKRKIQKKGQIAKKRPLSIPIFKDKIIQESIKIILEAIYEPIFSKKNYNFGFRAGKSAHHAMFYLHRNNSGCVTAIEGDIQGAYDNVNQEILIRILRKRISDEKFINLIKNGCKCGMLDQGKFIDTLTGIPQGGIASPILFNIYMHEFDEFINNELNNSIQEYNESTKRFEVGSKRRNPIYHNLSSNLLNARKKYNKIQINEQKNSKFIEKSINEKNKLIKQREKIKSLAKERLKHPSTLKRKSNIRIIYVRYADNWIILSNCNKKIAIDIKEKIKIWLKENLELTLSPEKTKITNLKKEPAKFLGFSLKAYEHPRLNRNEYGEVGRLSTSPKLTIDIDRNKAIDKLIISKFCDSKEKPLEKKAWSVLPPETIIRNYNYLVRGLAEYLLPVIDRVHTFNYIHFIINSSLLKTLAQKYKCTKIKILKRFGKPVKITIKEKLKLKKTNEEYTKEKVIQFISYLELKKLVETRRTFFLQGTLTPITSDNLFHSIKKINWRTMRNLTNKCILCSSDKDVEMHHVYAIRKDKVEGFTQVMKQLNRTMAPVCRNCHMKIHKGEIDQNIKMTETYEFQRFIT